MKFFSKGMIPWNKGKSFNEESRLKMSLSQKGKKQSKETIEKRAAKQRGRKMPLNVREALMKGRMGLKIVHSEESKKLVSGGNSKVARKIIQLDLNNKFIRQFDCISDACRFLNKGNSALWYALSDRSSGIYAGYKWMYLEKFKTITGGN